MSTLESYVPLIQAEAERLAQFLDTLSTDDLQRPSACELWEIHDVVAHLI
jgi:nitrogen-specific signal transduction histidine kinase